MKKMNKKDMDKNIKKIKTNTNKKDKSKNSYKAKYEEAQRNITKLQLEIITLKLENEKNIKEFKEKAQTFSLKAQKEVNKIKKTTFQKLENEKEQLLKYASQNLINSILEPLINIELAINAGKSQENVKSYVIGFEMLIKQIENELSNFGVKKIMPHLESDFDAKLHHAIAFKKGNKNKIIEVKKPGFKLYDRILKPAIVIIGK